MLYNNFSMPPPGKYSRTIKRIAAVILFLVILAFIIYVVLYVKSYIDVQNAIPAYEVIEIK